MNLTELVILSLAAWRLAVLFTRERGPFSIIERFREAIDANRLDSAENEQSYLFACLFCMSLWTAMVVWFIGVRAPVEVIATWGLATAIDSAIQRQ